MPLHDKIIGHVDKKIIDPKVNLEEYSVVPPQAVISTKVLMDMWERLGRPNTPFIPAGEKLMNIIIAIWEDGYPRQAREWYAERKIYQNAEMGITEQVHRHTGRSLASFPLPIYNIMRRLFRGFDPAERKNCMKMVKKWSMFRMCNRA